MATKALITEAELLRMTFDCPEPDYVDGELVERAMRLFALTELRIPTLPGHYRVADVAVYRRQPTDLIPAEAPFVALEIVSPDDKYEELITKLAEYQAIGVPHIWFADPGLQALRVYERGNLLHTDAFALPEFGLRFTATELFGPR